MKNLNLGLDQGLVETEEAEEETLNHAEKIAPTLPVDLMMIIVAATPLVQVNTSITNDLTIKLATANLKY